ncbi:hypothetical protein HUJ05_004613 [Dendroctonus ponderosae]|nr:hypothetical protein HUJ05_004613 [Dendroctonus ponderosae]
MIHSDQRPFECDICKQSFKTKPYLQTHRNLHTKEKQFHCKICNKPFAGRTAATYHLKTHSKERPFNCEKCNSRFQNEWCIQMKEEITIDEHDPFEVQHFEMKADERRSFNTEDQKTSQNALYCKICTQPCGGLLELNEHLRTHALERPHACDICNLRFKWKSNLAQHRNKHTREKRLACEICQQEFLLQNGWCIKVKEEVTIDEQDLSKLESIKLKADKTSTTNEFCCNTIDLTHVIYVVQRIRQLVS